jgi:hypothetical protein
MKKLSSNARRLGLLLAAPAAITIAITFAGCNSNDAPTEPAAPEQPQADPPETGAAEAAAIVTFNDNGELIRPVDYRAWTFVGTPVTPNEMNNGEAPFPEFHNVYIDPQSFEHYKQTGEFREGTVLIKELVSVGS